MKHYFPLMLLVCLAWTQVSFGQTTIPDVRFQEFAEGFTEPIDVQNAGDSRLFVVERKGKIWILDENGEKSDNPFLDIVDQVQSDGGEEGLLGMAFDPNYANNGRFYVNYINLDGNTHISRFAVDPNDPDQAQKASEEVLLVVEQPDEFDNHKSGALAFGPDKMLYIPLGDGGGAGDPFNNAQDFSLLLGKLSRIDVSGDSGYAIPPNNPFVNMPGARPEIWANGLRNPFRISFDLLTGDLWIGDVGQNRFEEVDFQAAGSDGGQNYGWHCAEGHRRFLPFNCEKDHYTWPIVSYAHDSTAPCGGTVIGGYVYRGEKFPNMFGKYVTIDYCTGALRIIWQDDTGAFQDSLLWTGDPLEYVSFGQDMNGEMYVVDFMGGEIYKVVDSSDLRSAATVNAYNISVYPNPNTGQFTVQWLAPSGDNQFLEVLTLLGETRYSEKVVASAGLNERILSLDKPSGGVYLVRIHTSQGVNSMKFTIE